MLFSNFLNPVYAVCIARHACLPLFTNISLLQNVRYRYIIAAF
jgi:ABC-type microcin C transport system permease subunit YejB